MIYLTIDKKQIKTDLANKLMTMFRKNVNNASVTEKYLAFGTILREYISKDWYDTEKKYINEKSKQVYYFSLEFLIGKLMYSHMINLGIKEICEETLAELGIDLQELSQVEPDAGLGNGGLGRLAACFLDSMASLKIPGHGMGIRYRYGLFEQKIENGYQIESPDNWLKIDNVWEMRKIEDACTVKFGGECNVYYKANKLYVSHERYDPVLAVPYDMPVPGYMNDTVNTLRLWSAETDGYSKGNVEKSVEAKLLTDSITYVLYPDDSTEQGRLLRLKQEYFFTSAGVQSIIKNVKKLGVSIKELDKYVAIQINDTHPALAVAEIMRILIDEDELEWEEAFAITQRTVAYTNHTIMAEALEKWSAVMLKKLLPRIYMIIEEINRRFCQDVSLRYKNDWNRINEMSIIQDGMIKMAHLAIVGSHSVNGVAELHTNILKTRELKNFNDFYPDKINNKTNGITHRRWLIKANPQLTDLIDSAIGDGWKKETERLSELKKYIKDKTFLDRIADVKRTRKNILSEYINKNYNISIDPDSIFDIQVKRLHMYKRQLLNILHIMDLYNRLREGIDTDIVPRTFIFGAKAFPGYCLAKNTIKLICTVADKINSDREISKYLKVVFMPNYSVSHGEIMIPAGEVSEQISTASMEASGTGNMKFMMNGAITIATMDGANVEIHREVGDDNIVVFGLSANEIMSYIEKGGYYSTDIIANDNRLKVIINQLQNGYFNTVSVNEFEQIIYHLK